MREVLIENPRRRTESERRAAVKAIMPKGGFTLESLNALPFDSLVTLLENTDAGQWIHDVARSTLNDRERNKKYQNPAKWFVYEIAKPANALTRFSENEANALRDRLNKSAKFEKFEVVGYMPYWEME